MGQDIYLVLDRVRSLYNVGSLFRTADAFGVTKIYLCGYTGAPPRKEISKVALGAEKTVPWEKRGQTWKLIEELSEQGIYIVALEQIPLELAPAPGGLPLTGQAKKSIPINKWKPEFPMAMVVGNEVGGVSRGVLDRVDKIIEISMLGVKESLNVAVAAGVALYAVRYQ